MVTIPTMMRYVAAIKARNCGHLNMIIPIIMLMMPTTRPAVVISNIIYFLELISYINS